MTHKVGHIVRESLVAVRGCLGPDHLEILRSVLRLAERLSLDFVLGPEERGVENDGGLIGRSEGVEILLVLREAHDIIGLATLGSQEPSVFIVVYGVAKLDELVVFGPGELEDARAMIRKGKGR
jgi:hypothetical protein